MRREADANATDGRNAPARHWLYLAAFASVYGLLFLAYYPPTHGVEDEVGFINQTLALSRGAITPEGAGFEGLQDFRPYKGRMVGIRNPGRPLISAPFVALGGLRGVFLPGALVHLGLTFVGALIFVRLGLSPLWGCLLLWHPTLCLYSRTVMGDTAAGLAVLFALLVLLSSRRPGAGAGLALGAAAVMRYQAGLVLPFFALAIFADPAIARRRREAFMCLLTGAGAGALIVAYNFHMYGNPTGIVKGEFGLRYFPGNLIFYSAVLLSIWPFMLIAPAIDRSRLRLASAAVCAPTFAFFCFYYFHDQGPGIVQTLVVGPRLIQIALPAWIVTYCVVMDRHVVTRLSGLIPRRAIGGLAGVALILLATFNGLMFARHQRHLENLIDLRAEIAGTVPPGSLLLSNSVAWKLLGVLYPAVPAYRLMQLGEPGFTAAAAREDRAWYISFLTKDPGASIDDEALSAAIARYACEPLETRHPELLMFRCPPGTGAPAP
ncbi:MAG TPA: hypothetical protein VGK94_06900 [Candidatus Polarisedimenticolia bacterium]